MTKDLYLKFPDSATADNLLFADDTTPLYRNIDVIGTIHKPTGKTSIAPDGEEIQEMIVLEGWHVNIRLMDDEDATPLEPYRVDPEPSTPVRVWS